MAIIDVCTYNGEKELWDLHYNVLKPKVDKFFVVEFDKTFSGLPKTPLFPQDQYPQVNYRVFSEKDWMKYHDLASRSPNTKGADHWKREFMQKECIKDALLGLRDKDIVFIGDVDEIWNTNEIWLQFDSFPLKIKLRVYTYWLNNRSNEEFWGTLVSRYKYIRKNCLNHLRTDSERSLTEAGWHFTSMGGPKALKQKLIDSYTKETYAHPTILKELSKRYGTQDFLGRNFTYTLNDQDWPEYLKRNKDIYKHLCQ